MKTTVDRPSDDQPIVHGLIALLAGRPDLAAALEESIRRADRPDIRAIAQYYDFLDRMVTLVPTDRHLGPLLLKSYYLIDLSPGRLLQTDTSFQMWTRKFAEDWGTFLDTPETAR